MSTKAFAALGLIAAAIFVAVITLTGGDDEAQASDVDGTFVADMVAHHEMAIEMAEMAESKAEHEEIKQLASDIVRAQSAEIDELNDVHQRLFGEPVGQMSHGSLGLSEEMTGMDMNMGALESAKPFDREFIDMMVAHHQGAVRMAQIEVAEGSDEETVAFAERVIEDQAMEIEQMNEWRSDWFGSPSPAGGVPDAESTEAQMEASSGSMPGMDH